MADELLTASQIQGRYKINRADLLAHENAGKITPTRTSGGQRRYNPKDIERLVTTPTVKEPTTAAYTDFGTPGLRRWGGSVYEERLTELRGRPGLLLYREMRWNDPVISATFYAIETTLKQAQWRVKAASEKQADKDCATFIDEALNDMAFTFNETLDFILEELESGYSLLEWTLKRRLGPNADVPSKFADGRIGWKQWSPRPAMTLAPGNEWIFDEQDNVIGINQFPEASRSGPYTVPAGKLLHFRTTARPANSPTGMPIHRSMYLPYEFTRNLQEIEGIGIERDLGNLPVVYLGNDCTTSGENSDFELAKQLVTNLRVDEQAGVVIPHAKMGGGAPEGSGMLLELLASGNARTHDISDIINRYDSRKALTVLAQFIMLGISGGSRSGGSYALSKTQSDLFSLSANAWLMNISSVINRTAIPALVRYNVFPGITGYPELVPSDTGLQDLKDVSAFINAMVGNNLIHADAELERHLRSMAKLPEPEEAGETLDGVKDVNSTQKPKLSDKQVKDQSSLLVRLATGLKTLQGAGIDDKGKLEGMIGPLLQELEGTIGSNNLLEPVGLPEPTPQESKPGQTTPALNPEALKAPLKKA